MRGWMFGVSAVLAVACGEKQPPAADGSELVCSETNPAPAHLRPLTRDEYDRTIEDLLGDGSAPARSFPPEHEVLGFRNNAGANPANPLLVEHYLNAAETLALRAVGERLDTIAPCDADEATCGQRFVREFGARAFRRPVTEAEAAPLDQLFTRYLPDGYAKAVEVTLSAMLQSPQFVYRIDSWRAPTEETGAITLGGYELASRLSYLLTGSMPDAELFAAAAEGRLVSDAEIEQQARRLLESPRAREVVRSFYEQWLGLSLLDGAARESEDVDAKSSDLVASWRESFRRYLDDVIWNEGTVSALLTSPKLYVDAELAPLYGKAPPAADFELVEQPEQRFGLLTQPALLALLAHANQTAPVLRGVFVRERIMCVEVLPPPPGINVIPPPVDKNATTRERFAQHTADPTCAQCHALIDGLGFGFERYDQFGRYREEENGLPVDDTGEVVATQDPELDGPYAGAGELAARLAQSSRVRDCMATNYYRFAMGRTETAADQCSLDQVKGRFAKSGGAFNELLVAITLSDAFRYRPALEEP